MKKISIFFFVFLAMVSILSIEKFFLRFFDSNVFVIIFLYFTYILLKEQIHISKVLKRDKYWIIILMILLIFDIYSLISA